MSQELAGRKLARRKLARQQAATRDTANTVITGSGSPTPPLLALPPAPGTLGAQILLP
ncbi:hypothetical protein EV666_101488 [Camelimonas lactis]|uniref:Uncharacterized protein n=1 Tax=Camelimonas lactis TaxID=659006 RepID=A0A4R2GYS8_9HYPH|nr:hypothetical protein EV666_101488 [Camelimonas lactis]